MDLNDFAYVVETNKKFEEAVVSVLKSVDKKGWALFNVYDIWERLTAKGFSASKLKIIEICSAKHANAMLSKNKLVSLCMPCKINVFEEGGKVKIASMRPTIISEFFHEVSKDQAEEVEKDVKEIVDLAK